MILTWDREFVVTAAASNTCSAQIVIPPPGVGIYLTAANVL